MKTIILMVLFYLSFLRRIQSNQPKSSEIIPENSTQQSILDTGIHSTKETINPGRLNLFQKIRVPVGGPYCYPEILNTNVEEDERLRRRTRLAYSPQQRDESHELMEPSHPKGIIENVWPYEKGQSQKKREIRKYVRLNVSPDLQDDSDYRLIGKAAERAFISRYYGLINSTERKTVDDLIRFIEDTEKTETHLALETDFDPLAQFNSWTPFKKSEFCKTHINYSIILFQSNIDFDSSSPTEIIREKKHVRYKNPLLASFIDTVDVVKCPCTDISNNTSLELGVLPVTYKYKQDFDYAFIYNYLEDDPRRLDKSGIGEVKVKALTKIDIEGIKEQRNQNQERNPKKSENKEDGKIDENTEGLGHKIVHTIFSPLENLHHDRESHSKEKNISQEKNNPEGKNDANTESEDQTIVHKILAPLGNLFHHHEHNQNSTLKKDEIKRQQKMAEEKNDEKEHQQMYRFLHLNHLQKSHVNDENVNKVEKNTGKNDEKEHKQRHKYLHLNMENSPGN